MDSGIGGLAFVDLCHKNVDCDIVFVMDNAFCPYGEKSPDIIKARMQKICEFLVDEKSVCAIVVACNTATSVAIDSLRKKISIPIIGMEPPIKMAVDEGKKNIIVVSTPVTNKFCKVIKKYEKEAMLVSFSNLAKEIEDNFFLLDSLSEYIKKGFCGVGTKGCDAVVLGCSHFQFVEKQIREVFEGDVEFFHSEYGVLKRLVQILGKTKCDEHGKIAIFQTQYDESLLKIAKEILCR